MTILIRTIAEDDREEWLKLWNAYLAFYKVDIAPAVTEKTWSRIVDPGSPLTCRVAEVDGRVAGFAIHFTHPSTWVIEEDCYLEDLYVDEDLRGQGVGRALIDDLVGLAEEHGWARLYWHTDEGNHRARKLYDSYVEADGHVRYRINFSRRRKGA